MLTEDSVKELKTTLRGGVLEPGDKGYDEARKVYNGMIHNKPRLIARCADVADVIRSVNFARENNTLLAIRSGGHNAGGLGICDDGLVIDAIHPYSAGGAYVNFLMGDEGEDRVKKTYGDNFERLVAIKSKYDPGNLFRVNQNIKPTRL